MVFCVSRVSGLDVSNMSVRLTSQKKILSTCADKCCGDGVMIDDVMDVANECAVAVRKALLHNRRGGGISSLFRGHTLVSHSISSIAGDRL